MSNIGDIIYCAFWFLLAMYLIKHPQTVARYFYKARNIMTFSALTGIKSDENVTAREATVLKYLGYGIIVFMIIIVATVASDYFR